MAPTRRRRDLVTSRRRALDEDEEEGPGPTSAGYDSASDLSIPSDADDSVDAGDSDVSDTDGAHFRDAKIKSIDANGVATIPDNSGIMNHPQLDNQGSHGNSAFVNTADTEAMINGLDATAQDRHEDAIDFEDAAASLEQQPITSKMHNLAAQSARSGHSKGSYSHAHIVSSPQQNGFHQASTTSDRHLESLQNPGGSVMQDRRNGAAGPPGFVPPIPRGRKRGPFGPLGSSLSNDRWDHDLHQTVADAKPAPKSGTNGILQPRNFAPVPRSEAPTVRNKAVSIGTVTCRVFIPGMNHPISFEKMPVRQHIRLPDLRPPLRRDKPVRISLPESLPRYIFPSPERSFIFIPRAQRPNQQGNRLRGRGGFYSHYGSRRSSFYGGSNYTPSLPLSRRSSQARDGFISPTGSTFSRPPLNAPLGPTRPVVRLPTQARPHDVPLSNTNAPIHATAGPPPGVFFPSATESYPMSSRPPLRENRDIQIPMHQPRPQKQVSVASIESPHQGTMPAPKQQEQQPFHHQVPSQVQGHTSPQHQGPTYPSPRNNEFNQPQVVNSSSTAFPTRAVNAQPFQPNPQHTFFQPYPVQNHMFYPPEQQMQFGTDPNTHVYESVLPQGGNYMMPMVMGPPPPPPPPPGTDQAKQGHATLTPCDVNGTIYYYDPSPYQASGDGVAAANYAVPGAGGIMTPGPEGGYYYTPAPPPMVFYQAQ